jgi:hypothetical protein
MENKNEHTDNLILILYLCTLIAIFLSWLSIIYELNAIKQLLLK